MDSKCENVKNVETHTHSQARLHARTRAHRTRLLLFWVIEAGEIKGKLNPWSKVSLANNKILNEFSVKYPTFGFVFSSTYCVSHYYPPFLPFVNADVSHRNQTLQHPENVDRFSYTWAGHVRPWHGDASWTLASFLQNYLVSLISSAKKFCVTLLTKVPGWKILICVCAQK